jgi:serine/threonine-protein kinase
MGCLDDQAVIDFVEARLVEDLRRTIERHLDDCEGCRVLVAHAAAALVPTSPMQDPRAVPPAATDPLEAPQADPAPAELGPGAVVGRYRIVARLGSGAMGTVYSAEHRDLPRRVALKVVRTGVKGESQLAQRLMREARAAAAVVHPNVVTVHDVLTLGDGSPVLVMDLLEGETLRAYLVRHGRMATELAVRVALEILAALEVAHARGIVHRDLKPDNVFLVPEPDGAFGVRIVDFGIAKLTAIDGPLAETAGLTETGMLVGTPHYMAPEQAFGDETIDGRADLWAVGVILYECLTGRLPIEGSHVGQILKRLAQLDLVPLSQALPQLPPSLTAVCDQLLADRTRRPAHASEVRARLSQALAAALADVDAREVDGAPVRASRPPREASTPLALQAPIAQAPRSRPIAVALAAVAVIATLLVIGGVRFGEPPAQRPRAAATPEVAPPAPSPTPSPSAAPEPTAAPRAKSPQPTPSAELPRTNPRRVTAPPPASSSAATPPSPGPGNLVTEPPF